MRHSVEGYNIYDGDGNILYDGDIVLFKWGGGNDGKRYKTLEFHELSISKRGKLKLSGCSNIIRGKDLIKIYPLDREFQARGLNNRFKVYY